MDNVFCFARNVATYYYLFFVHDPCKSPTTLHSSFFALLVQCKSSHVSLCRFGAAPRSRHTLSLYLLSLFTLSPSASLSPSSWVAQALQDSWKVLLVQTHPPTLLPAAFGGHVIT